MPHGIDAVSHLTHQLAQALRSFSLEEQGAFLRFVTSVSRGPLLGFRYLEPPLCIQVGCAMWCQPRSRPLLRWLGEACAGRQHQGSAGCGADSSLC
jgi:HECT-domain (ubiquitin-transferase)